jgi:tryptophanyl-tRNA synthetase
MKQISLFPKTVLTGDRPTGSLHLGHFVGSIENRIKLQNEYDECFYMIADIQALTDNAGNPQKVIDNVYEVVLDNLACGLDPEKTCIYIQSQIPQIAELTVLFMNLVTMQQMLHNPTIKSESLEKNFSLGGETSSSSVGIPLGFLAYPVSQAADILIMNATTIPVGADQLPVIEVTRDIAKKFNNLYSEIFTEETSGILSQTPRLIGTDGSAKASKSLGNAIFIKDSLEIISKKVMSMFTCPSKLSVSSCVSEEELKHNVVFQYLDIFDSEVSEVKKLKESYKNGEIGDVVVKKRLISVLDETFSPIREKREKLAENMNLVREIVEKGTQKARQKAEITMQQVRKAMGIDYF